METVYLNIQFDPNKAKRQAKRQFKRKFNLMVIRILFVVFLGLILFGMLKSVAPKTTGLEPIKGNTIEVTRGNRKLDHEELHSTMKLIPPEASMAETDSTRTAEFVATAYCGCEKCCGRWASLRGDGPVTGAAGVPLIEGVSVAVDNNLYKFGTEFTDEEGNTYIAADTGSAIVGNRIDVYFEDHEMARQFGRQTITLSWEE